MPVAIPNDVGAPRATSRRGGRSRSPVSNTPRDEAPSTAAAAAAAAAAKAYRSWPGEGTTPERGGNSDQHIFRQTPGTPGTPGSAPWPPGSPATYHPHHGPPPPGYPPHPHHRGGRYPPPHPAYGDPYGQHPDPRAVRGGRSYGPPPPGYPPRPGYNDPYRYTSPQRRMRPPSLSPKPRNRASVFRKPPTESKNGEAAPDAATNAEDDDEDSPQRILLSLRTPSHSFDQKDGNATSILKAGDDDDEEDLEKKLKSDETRRSSPTDPLLVVCILESSSHALTPWT